MQGCFYYGGQQELWDGGYAMNIEFSTYLESHRYKGMPNKMPSSPVFSTYLELHRYKRLRLS